MEDLLEELLESYPLPPGVEVVSADEVPPPRVALEETTLTALEECIDPLDDDETFHTATVKENKRITATDWYQDVRHLEFDLNDDIQYAGNALGVVPEFIDVIQF
jgi:sulfite reductase alpha subunit-like flavoprotein